MQTSFSKAQADHKQLLFNVKSTVEHLLLNNKTTSTKLDGLSIMQNADEVALLHSAVEQIFVHGIRLFKSDLSPDMWPFIEGLNWLNPAMTVSVGNNSFTAESFTTAHHKPKPFGRIKSDKALVWVFDNLASNQLIYKLQYLVSDTEHLNSCFEVWAFLQSSKYLNAFLLCLRAIENNQPNLLTQIDTNLLPGKTDPSHLLPTSHKRSTSHPNFSFIPGAPSKTVPKKSSKPTNPIRQQSQQYPQLPLQHLKPLRTCKSLPNLHVDQVPPRTRSQTISQPICISKPPNNLRFVRDQKVPAFSYRVLKPIVDKTEPDSSDDLQLIQIIKCDDIKIHEHSASIPSRHPSDLVECGSEASSINTSQKLFSFMPNWSTGEKSEATSPTSYLNLLTAPAPADFVNAFVPKEGEKLISRNTGSVGSLSPIFNPSDDNDTNKTSTSHESPSSVQSLTSFLQSGRFSRANSDLERENAHFCVSEAMISAIEQIKCKVTIDGPSDDIPPVRRRFADQVSNRARRRPIQEYLKTEHRMSPKCGRDSNDKYRRTVMYVSNSSSASSSMASSCSPPTPSRSYQQPPNQHTPSVPDRIPEAVAPIDSETPTQNINAECEAYAEWGGNAIENWSAESVALSLISKFSDKQMPRTCDLLWLVSEQDAKQDLLPMPASWAVNPDEPYKVPFTRGTRDWAPPRAQVIFTRHEKIDRKSLLLKQNQRCAGCGMKVAPAYSHHFRYCEYLGRFHCTNCHRNQISVIPARVLDRWDFGTFPVSVFSYRLLEEIWNVPLFRVSDLNAPLYGRVRALQVARERRALLKFVRDFVVSCRFAEEDGTKAIVERVAKHIVEDVDLWSMADFTAVRLGTFIKDITALTNGCETHVLSCELCKARGFICELCPRKQVIFPWQSKVRRCAECGVCVHDSCWKDDCSKCDRLRKRRQNTTVPVRLSTVSPATLIRASAISARSSTDLR